MRIKNVNLLKYFTVFTLFSMLTGLTGIGYFYWSSGLMDGSKLSAIYESSTWLEDIQRNNYIERMERDVSKSKVSTALKDFERLDLKVRDINRIAELDSEYAMYMKTRNQTKTRFEKLLSYPNATKIYDVFSNKLRSFEKFVITNRWPTLSRMSSRMLTRVRKLGAFNYPEIDQLSKTVESELEVMRKVTNRSVLSRDDKEMINKRLDSIAVEVKMLSDYNNDLKLFFKDYRSFKTSYRDWLGKVAPEVSYGKLSLSNKTKQFAMIFFSVCAVLLLLVFMTPFVLRVNKKHQNKVKENFALDLVNNKLIPHNSEFIDGSEHFTTEMKKKYQYIQKRMSFGSTFQESLPFPAILLNENLKLIWANKVFQDEWGITRSQIDNDSIDWDLVHRFTNLGDVDPVIDALQNDLSGIYQIQAKLSGESNPVPYEMYMRPVASAGQKRIMLFFYPLKSIEQTINDQAKSIIVPVQKSLRFVLNDEFYGAKEQELQDEFFVAGIDDVFDQFQGLNQKIKTADAHSQKRIEVLEEDKSELKETIELLKNNIEEIALSSREAINTYIELKQRILDYSQFSHKANDFSVKILDSLETTLVNFRAGIQTNEGNIELLKENLKAYSSLTKIKGVLKELTEGIENSKFEISQSCDQLMVFSRSENIEPMRLEQALLKLKGQVKTLEVNTDQYHKSLRALDVIVSKQEMISQGTQDPMKQLDINLELLATHGEVQRTYTDYTEDHRSLVNKLNDLEDNLVGALEKSYVTSKATHEKVKKVNTALAPLNLETFETNTSNAEV